MSKVILSVLIAIITTVVPLSISFANSSQPEFVALGCQTVCFHTALSIDVKAKGLVPDKGYVLGLEGKPGYPGNERLRECNERIIVIGGITYVIGFYDHPKLVNTDSRGELNSSLLLDNLSKGKYNVKFMIKSSSKEPVLMFDDMVFEIKENPCIETLLGRLIIGIIGAIIGGLLVSFVIAPILRKRRGTSLREAKGE